MSPARAALAMPTDETAEAADIVERFLDASMVPDPETAARYIAADLKITFTGGRKYSHPRETAGFNAKRYKWVKKKMERTDVVPGQRRNHRLQSGTLYGEWPDGTSFEGNRYVDRFVVRDGKIVQMDVWNDSAERLLTPQRHRGLVHDRAPASVVRLTSRGVTGDRMSLMSRSFGGCATISARSATASRC